MTRRLSATRYGADMPGYRDLFDASITDPAGFWADAATAVTWTREPQRVLDDTNPPFYRWFPDGELNTCANALDRHIGSLGVSALYENAFRATCAPVEQRCDRSRLFLFTGKVSHRH